jgi:hypothetical protein
LILADTEPDRFTFWFEFPCNYFLSVGFIGLQSGIQVHHIWRHEHCPSSNHGFDEILQESYLPLADK